MLVLERKEGAFIKKSVLQLFLRSLSIIHAEIRPASTLSDLGERSELRENALGVNIDYGFTLVCNVCYDFKLFG